MRQGSVRRPRDTGRRRALLSIALLSVMGCSKHPTRPREPSELLGTPVTPANTVEYDSHLLWSAVIMWGMGVMSLVTGHLSKTKRLRLFPDK